MRSRRIVIGVLLTAGLAVGGLAIGTIASAAVMQSTPPVASSSTDDGRLQPQEYPKNASGQTYGSAFGATWETIPDLVLVITDQGGEGFVPREAVFVPPAESPDAALGVSARSEQIDATDSDGKTVVGTYTLDPGTSSQE